MGGSWQQGAGRIWSECSLRTRSESRGLLEELGRKPHESVPPEKHEKPHLCILNSRLCCRGKPWFARSPQN